MAAALGIYEELIMNTNRNQIVAGAFIGETAKKDRYAWNEPETPGAFAWLPKEKILINHAYQRDRINETRINEIASAWSWIRCGALSIAKREGKFYAMDGQHRLLAAMKRADIETMPCIIFTAESLEVEANSFVALNSHKTAVAGVDRFKAMVVAGDQMALAVRNMLQDTGHSVGPTSSAKTVSCILTIWKMYSRDPSTMESLWPLIADVAPGQAITDSLVRSMFGVEKLVQRKQKTIVEPPYRAKLIEFGALGIVNGCRQEKQIIGKGGERIETAALVKMLNKSRLGAGNKIEMD